MRMHPSRSERIRMVPKVSQKLESVAKVMQNLTKTSKRFPKSFTFVSISWNSQRCRFSQNTGISIFQIVNLLQLFRTFKFLRVKFLPSLCSLAPLPETFSTFPDGFFMYFSGGVVNPPINHYSPGTILNFSQWVLVKFFRLMGAKLHKDGNCESKWKGVK